MKRSNFSFSTFSEDIDTDLSAGIISERLITPNVLLVLLETPVYVHTLQIDLFAAFLIRDYVTEIEGAEVVPGYTPKIPSGAQALTGAELMSLTQEEASLNGDSIKNFLGDSFYPDFVKQARIHASYMGDFERGEYLESEEALRLDKVEKRNAFGIE